MAWQARKKSDNVAPKKRLSRFFACLYCDFQAFCTEAEITKHIIDKHEKLYVPRSKKGSL